MFLPCARLLLKIHKLYLSFRYSILEVVTMERLPKRLKFLHNIPADYKIYPANGAWGGVTARGDLLLHFFIEHQIVPKEQIQDVKADGSLAPLEVLPKEEVEVARDMQVGIMINLDQAADVAKWMLAKVEQYRKIASGKVGSISESSQHTT